MRFGKLQCLRPWFGMLCNRGTLAPSYVQPLSSLIIVWFIWDRQTCKIEDGNHPWVRQCVSWFAGLHPLAAISHAIELQQYGNEWLSLRKDSWALLPYTVSKITRGLRQSAKIRRKVGTVTDTPRSEKEIAIATKTGSGRIENVSSMPISIVQANPSEATQVDITKRKGVRKWTCRRTLWA